MLWTLFSLYITLSLFHGLWQLASEIAKSGRIFGERLRLPNVATALVFALSPIGLDRVAGLG
jgi:hypothetical protein